MLTADPWPIVHSLDAFSVSVSALCQFGRTQFEVLDPLMGYMYLRSSLVGTSARAEQSNNSTVVQRTYPDIHRPSSALLETQTPTSRRGWNRQTAGDVVTLQALTMNSL